MFNLLTFTLAVELFWQWLSLSSAIHIFTFLLVTFHCLKERREATSALLWIFLAWSFPVIGPLFYLSAGINQTSTKGWLKQRADKNLLGRRQEIEQDETPELTYWRAVHKNCAAEPKSEFAQGLNKSMNAALPDYPLLGGNDVQLLLNGDEAYPAMLKSISGARDHIHLQSFIIHGDKTGKNFMDALVQKAREGVKVRVIYDRFGSTYAVLTGFFRKYRKIPNLEIIGWTQVNLIKRQFQLNLRNHRKLLIIDGREAFTGGINISNGNISNHGELGIQDYHFKVTGPIVQEMQFSFMGDWYFMTSQDPAVLLSQRYFPRVEPTGDALVRLVKGDPSGEEANTISDVYFTCIVSAKKDILVTTPYLVPTQDLLKAFRTAALRGVRIRLVVPEKNNHFYAGIAARARYEALMVAGVEIYERKPPFIHAKSMVIDDSVAIIGSANWDERSLRLSYETNFAVYDEKLANEIKRAILSEIEQSNKIELQQWRMRPFSQRIAENFCNLMTPIL